MCPSDKGQGWRCPLPLLNHLELLLVYNKRLSLGHLSQMGKPGWLQPSALPWLPAPREKAVARGGRALPDPYGWRSRALPRPPAAPRTGLACGGAPAGSRAGGGQAALP